MDRAMNVKVFNKKGQSMVEFALVLPVLLIFFAGIVEFGLILNDYITLNRAVANACKYGATLVGYSSAEVLVAAKFVDGLGENVKLSNVRIKSRLSTKIYKNISKSANGTLSASPDALFSGMFYRYDSGTQSNFSDDIVMAPPLDWRTSYAIMEAEYDHEIVVPFLGIFADTKFMISTSNTFPISGYYSNLMPGFRLKGSAPIAINEKCCVLNGKTITLVDTTKNMPGSFDWLDISVYVAPPPGTPVSQTGNPNAAVPDLNTWITGLSTPGGASDTIDITPPQDVYSMTGRKVSAFDSLAPMVGKQLLLPIYNSVAGQGNYSTYHIIGFAIFLLNGYTNDGVDVTYVRTVSRVQ